MPTISTERSGPTAVVTIDNPEAFNALTPDMVSSLTEAVRDAAADRACRAIVLTGAGDRAFCAGVDVKSVAQRDATGGDDLDPIEEQFENLHLHLGAMIRTVHEVPVPVIAAVDGHAIGAGFALAAASDLRVVSPGARFADGFIARGISGCELGLSYFLPRLVGAAVAFEWMLTGRRVDGEEARRTGFASLADDGAVVERALSLATQLAERAPMAVAMTKEVMWANLHAASLDHALALESRTQVMTRNTADAGEARRSFLEKRDPSFATSDRPRRLR